MNHETNIKIRVMHRFDQPPERVFDAWLDSMQVGKWLFATPTGRMVRVEIDPRVGGTFILVDRREGEDIEHVGTYLDIDRPRLLSFRFAVPKYSSESALVTVDIAPSETGCELILTQHLPVSHAEYASRTEEGWTKILDKLDTLLG